MYANTHAYTHTHTAGLLRTSDQVIAEVSTYTTEQTQDTNIHALSGNRTCNTSNRAAVEPLLLLLLLLFTAIEFSLGGSSPYPSNK